MAVISVKGDTAREFSGVVCVVLNPQQIKRAQQEWTFHTTLQALKQARSLVLEPVMSLEITVDEDHLSVVLADLAQRRGSSQEIQNRQDNRVALASVPLAEMVGYSTALRTLTSGIATFTLELSHYEAMTPQDQNMLLNKVTGVV